MIFGRALGRWRGALAALVAIAVYSLLVGADAAVVRAAIMGGVSPKMK
jgi:predicted membrane metal-binding protein